MVEDLVGDLEGLLAGLALWHNHVDAVLDGHLDALLLLRHRRADGTGCRLALAGVDRHFLATYHRRLVGEDLVVLARPDGHFDGDKVVLQVALLRSGRLAVLVAIPDLLAQVIEDPLGLAADGPGYRLADGSLHCLADGLQAGLAARFRRELLLLDLVVADNLRLDGRLCALRRTWRQVTPGDGHGGADLRHQLLTLLRHSVGAELGLGGIVQQVTVARDVHAGLVVAVLAAVVTMASLTLILAVLGGQCSS